MRRERTVRTTRAAGYGSILLGLPVITVMVIGVSAPTDELWYYLVHAGRKISLAFCAVAGLALYDRWRGIDIYTLGDTYYGYRFLGVALILALG